MYERAALARGPEVVGKLGMGQEIRDVSEFEQCKNNMDDEIERLGDSVGRFINRMAPVLRDGLNPAAEDAGGSAPAPAKAAASESLDRMAFEIRRIRAIVENALERSAF